jgi:hypothetical protein
MFSEKVKSLSNGGLVLLVNKVTELCPYAIDDVDDEKIHIKVDKIEKDKFIVLQTLVEDTLKE